MGLKALPSRNSPGGPVFVRSAESVGQFVNKPCPYYHTPPAAVFTPHQTKRKDRMKTKTQGGFTLVEIMIVVAIIGLLASVAIPNYVHARLKTQRVGCINNLQLIDAAVQQWAMDYGKGAGQTVQYSDLRPYFGRTVKCPAGGASFEDSYQLTTVETPCACLRSPSGDYAHKQPQ
jgi:prepilin-type N-terminal cleavage/methylation domain-containing protein